MKCSFNEIPFKYGVIHNLLTKEENSILHNICEEFYAANNESVDDLSYFVLDQDRARFNQLGKHTSMKLGLYQNNVAVNLTKEQLKVYETIINKVNSRFNQADILKTFPIKYREDGTKMEYHSGLCITANLTEFPLLPHTDNPEELKQYGIDNNISVSCGIYKGVIYITNDNLDYTHYGTRFYNINQPNNPNVPNNLRYTEILEAEFNGGDACIFETGPHSWHGTDFKNGLPHNRFTITFEYF